MVAFVNDQMPVVRHAVIDDALADEALDERDVDATGQLFMPAAKPAATETPAATTTAPATPRFELTPPPPGQDLDAGLKDASTEVPTIKVEEAPPAPKN